MLRPCPGMFCQGSPGMLSRMLRLCLGILCPEDAQTVPRECSGNVEALSGLTPHKAAPQEVTQGRRGPLSIRQHQLL